MIFTPVSAAIDGSPLQNGLVLREAEKVLPALRVDEQRLGGGQVMKMPFVVLQVNGQLQIAGLMMLSDPLQAVLFQQAQNDFSLALVERQSHLHSVVSGILRA